MKKVLIITYYWVPSGGAGVQRWVKTVKYLPQFGWQPIVYTPENPEYPSIDHSFERDLPENLQVIKTKIWEPYNIYRSLFGKKGEPINAGFISENKKSGFKERLSIWIRGNFFIPDPRRFWIKPSVKFLSNYLKTNKIDAVITTGPPHSMHLIGLGLKKNFPDLTWIADFRDPWTNFFLYKDLHLFSITDHIHHQLEQKIVQNCDCFVTVSENLAKSFLSLNPKRIELIYNGFDEYDYPNKFIALDKKFVITHIGTLDKARNSSIFWSVLAEICSENQHFSKDLEIILIGKIDFSIIQEIENMKLKEKLKKIEYLSHFEAIEQQRKSHILLLLLIDNTSSAKGIITGKFYEYLAARRPIFVIGPTDGDVAAILHKTKAGKIADFNDFQTIKNIILEFYNQFKNNTLQIHSENITQYSRRNLTQKYAELLNDLI
ncbi:MAG: glycosyltransferase [Paludibacter sp.]|nr:glycosyltransferase [Paludibacter sp.]